MGFISWSRFCTMRENDMAFSAEVDVDMEGFKPGVALPKPDWNPECVEEITESGYELLTNVRLASEKDVKGIPKKVLNKMPSAMVKMRPRGPKVKVWLFLDDSPATVGLTQVRFFTKVAVKRSAQKLHPADHSFKSLAQVAFNDSIDKHALKFGDQEIDVGSLPSFAEYFCNEEEAPDKGGEHSSPEDAAELAGAVASPAAPQRVPGTSPARVPAGSLPPALKISPRPSPTKRAGSFGGPGSSRDGDADDTRSVVSESDTVDLSQVPLDLEAACAFWMAKMPLDRILAGAKLGHAMRQGMDLVQKHTSDEQKFGIVSPLNLHCKLAGLARAMAPGKKCMEAMNDSDLRDGAERLMAADVPLPLHVTEQFLLRHIARLRDQLRSDSVESWCKTFVATVVPWRRDGEQPFNIDGPKVSTLVASESSKLDFFKKSFISEFLVPQIMKGDSVVKNLKLIVSCCCKLFENDPAVSMSAPASEVFMELLSALRGLGLVLDHTELLRDYSSLSDARALHNEASKPRLARSLLVLGQPWSAPSSTARAWPS